MRHLGQIGTCELIKKHILVLQSIAPVSEADSDSCNVGCFRGSAEGESTQASRETAHQNHFPHTFSALFRVESVVCGCKKTIVEPSVWGAYARADFNSPDTLYVDDPALIRIHHVVVRAPIQGPVRILRSCSVLHVKRTRTRVDEETLSPRVTSLRRVEL